MRVTVKVRIAIRVRVRVRVKVDANLGMSVSMLVFKPDSVLFSLLCAWVYVNFFHRFVSRSTDNNSERVGGD